VFINVCPGLCPGYPQVVCSSSSSSCGDDGGIGSGGPGSLRFSADRCIGLKKCYFSFFKVYEILK